MRILLILCIALVLQQTYAQATFGLNEFHLPPINLIAVFNFLRKGWKKLTHSEASRTATNDTYNSIFTCIKNGPACEETSIEDMATIPNNTMNEKILLRLKSKNSDTNWRRLKDGEEEGRFNPMFSPSPDLRSVLWIRFYYTFVFVMLIILIIFWAPYFFTGMILQELKEGSEAEEGAALDSSFETSNEDMDMIMMNSTMNDTMTMENDMAMNDAMTIEDNMEQCMEDPNDLDMEQMNDVSQNYSNSQIVHNSIKSQTPVTDGMQEGIETDGQGLMNGMGTIHMMQQIKGMNLNKVSSQTTVMDGIQRDRAASGQEQMNAMPHMKIMNALNDLQQSNGMSQSAGINHKNYMFEAQQIKQQHGLDQLHPTQEMIGMGTMTHEKQIEGNGHTDGIYPAQLIGQWHSIGNIEQLNTLKTQSDKGTTNISNLHINENNDNVKVTQHSRMDHGAHIMQQNNMVQIRDKFHRSGNKIATYAKDNNGNEQNINLGMIIYQGQFEGTKHNEGLKRTYSPQISMENSPNMESRIGRFHFNHFNHFAHKKNKNNVFGQIYNMRVNSVMAQNYYMNPINNMQMEVNHMESMEDMRQMAGKEDTEDDMLQMNSMPQMKKKKRKKKRKKLKCIGGKNSTRYANNVLQDNDTGKLDDMTNNGIKQSNRLRPIIRMNITSSTMQANGIQHPLIYAQSDATNADANVNDNEDESMNAKEQMKNFQQDETKQWSPINETRNTSASEQMNGTNAKWNNMMPWHGKEQENEMKENNKIKPLKGMIRKINYMQTSIKANMNDAVDGKDVNNNRNTSMNLNGQMSSLHQVDPMTEMLSINETRPVSVYEHPNGTIMQVIEMKLLNGTNTTLNGIQQLLMYKLFNGTINTTIDLTSFNGENGLTNEKIYNKDLMAVDSTGKSQNLTNKNITIISNGIFVMSMNDSGQLQKIDKWRNRDKLSHYVNTNSSSIPLNVTRSDLLNSNIMNRTNYHVKKEQPIDTGLIYEWRHIINVSRTNNQTQKEQPISTGLIYDTTHINNINRTNNMTKKEQSIGTGLIYELPYINNMIRKNNQTKKEQTIGTGFIYDWRHINNMNRTNYLTKNEQKIGTWFIYELPHINNMNRTNNQTKKEQSIGTGVFYESPHINDMNRTNNQTKKEQSIGTGLIYEPPHINNMNRTNNQTKKEQSIGTGLIYESPHIKNMSRTNNQTKK